jgi:MFS family permease
MGKYTSIKNFLMLWLGQSVSQLGSSMTGFAITIWAYEETGSVFALSIAGLLIMVPKMVFGIFVGPLVDRLNKKAIMILTDIGAGLCTFALFLLLRHDVLEIGHIYIINVVSNVLGSFQSPASNVVVSAVVPKEHYVRANGLQSFSDGTMQILAPVFAAALLGFAGISGVIVFDFISLAFAIITLALGVKIPIINRENGSAFSVKQYFNELRQGFDIIKKTALLCKLMMFMVFINFLAGITYYNLLSPMILARTANSSQALGFVNGALGLGSVAGALLVLIVPTVKRKIKIMFLCCTLSFLLGDVLLSLGSTLIVWTIAGFFSSLFLPLFNANENYFWRTIIPLSLQGRAFSLKYALQSGIVPIGMLLGGWLADYVFEPMMTNSGKGAGMAVIFFITGISGAVYSIFGIFNRSMQKAEANIETLSNPNV